MGESVTPDWKECVAAALVAQYDDVWVLHGARTPFADYNGAFADISGTDLGIKAGRAAIARAGIDGAAVDVTFAAQVAPSSFDALLYARHVGLYAGVPASRPALQVHRICCSGFETITQAAAGIAAGSFSTALCVGAENMTRHPIAAFSHRGGFRLGQVEFGDYLTEGSMDTAPGTNMGGTAENLAKLYAISREEVDEFAGLSFARAVAAQASGALAEEIVPVVNESFELPRYATRKIRLPRDIDEVAQDTHIRPTSLDALKKLRASFSGVQTGGNSSAIVDGGAAVIVTGGAGLRDATQQPLGRVVAAATVGVPPEIMGIGPVPAIMALLDATGLALADIDRIEINEAFAAQTLACVKDLGLDLARLNVNGGAIAFGHPLAATGVRATLSCLLELRRAGLRRGIVSACAGGGQGMALLLEAA
ncbi:MAG: thiolase family protein [Xanthobacteraceae bacterium]|nr:MAG: thiolase family protein [Xanthobacteraceae bacterium]